MSLDFSPIDAPRRAKAPLRAGIFTYHFSDNFGALMQAYGTFAWLRQQGVEAEFINYHPAHVEAGGTLRNPLRPGGLKANLKILYLQAARLQRHIMGDAEQQEKFTRFQRETLGVTGPVLRTAEEVETYLNSPEGKFDLLLCGSDQIWSPSDQFGLDPVYFLAFASDLQGAKRISYAPSFGRGTLDPTYEDEVKGYLAALDGISVREESGVEIAKTLSGRDVAWVPDPTILLGDFSALAAAGTAQEGHVYCYTLRTGQGIREAALTAGKQLGCPVLSPYNIHRRWPEIGTTIYPSPEDWVANFKGAACVVTNSFHGTVLSILFRRPFLTIALPGHRAGLNERAKDLLGLLGLSDRLVDGTDTALVQRRLETPIDWDAVDAKLTKLQDRGRDFLATEVAMVAQ